MPSSGRQLGSRKECRTRAERAVRAPAGYLVKGFCVEKAFFGIRNLNSHSGQAGQPSPIFPRDDYCKGRDFVLWGGIHSQGWTTRLRAGSDTPEVSLPVTRVPWCSCLVGSPIGLFLSMCMTAAVVRDGRVIPQQTAFPAAAPHVPARERTTVPCAA